jgi:glutamate 5-kinase
MRTKLARAAKRVVVKVGSSLLSGGRPGLDGDYVARLVDALASEIQAGREISLVTSGAIAAGLEPLGLTARPKSLRHLQAAAAVGQVSLVHAYEEEFRRHGLVVAQVLLTRDGVEHRGRYLNARNTLVTLLEEGAVPIVNENDTVSVDEIRFGDNDTLAALVTKLVDADVLVVLTDVDGLCTSDPRKGEAKVIADVDDITPEIERCASGPGNVLGSGGMVTKLEAARMATAAGAGMFLVNGADPEALNRVLAGEDGGTFFSPRKDPLEARKFWIAFASARTGAVVVNEGARRAIVEKGTSLLPVGVVGASGDFDKGDTVAILDEDGREFARGVSYYASSEVTRIRGCRTPDLATALGAAYSEDEVIHRNNLVLL